MAFMLWLDANMLKKAWRLCLFANAVSNKM